MVSSVRLEKGASHQDNVAIYLESAGFNIKSVAKKGSTEPDIIALKKYKTIQMEIKGSEGFNESGTFDVTMNRSKISLDPKTKPSYIKKMNELVKRIANSKGYVLNDKNKNYIEQYVDLIRKKDTSIGFVGDKGISSATAGTLTVDYFKSEDRDVIKYALEFAKFHLKESNDDYFCLVNSINNNFIMFGAPNPSLFPNLNIRSMTVSDIKNIRLKTAGNTTNGKIRVSLMLSYNKNRFTGGIKPLF